jgi:hypothetical protein
LATPDHIEIKLMLSVISNSSEKPLKTIKKKVELLVENPKPPPHS